MYIVLGFTETGLHFSYSSSHSLTPTARVWTSGQESPWTGQPTRGAHWHLSPRYHGNLALVRKKKLNVNDTQGTGTPSREPAISLRAATAEPFPSEAPLPYARPCPLSQHLHQTSHGSEKCCPRPNHAAREKNLTKNNRDE